MRADSGSKRKYKKCCGQRTAAVTFTPQDRQQALDLLREVADAPRFADEVDEAWAEFIEANEEALDRPGFEHVASMSEDAYQGWLYFDRLLSDGRRLVDHALLAVPPGARGVRAYLEAGARSPMRVFEVVAVSPGESLTLRDLLDGDQVKVRERSASRPLRVRSHLAARVMPGASGQPEMDQGCLPIWRDEVPELVNELRTERADRSLSAAQIREGVPLAAHDAWLAPLHAPLPKLVTGDGDELLFTRARFAVRDAERLTVALDAVPTMSRDDEGVWHWSEPPKPDGTATSLGTVRLDGDKLVLECLSAPRGERGRALIEGAAGDVVRFLAMSHEHPEQLLNGDVPAPRDGAPTLDKERVDRLKLEFLTKHYRKWVDEPVPALDGRTPREAAKTELRPRVVELLDGLEDLYRDALARGEAQFDPSGLWSELGLDDDTAAPTRPTLPPATGAETMAALVPGLLDTAREVAGTLRRRPDFDAGTVIDGPALSKELAALRFLKAQAVAGAEAGLPPERAAGLANLLGAHLEYLVNFEAHRRKTFWVSESLAWMLGHTEVDLTGDSIRPPFASLALVFTDRATLVLAERMLAADAECDLRGAVLKVATVHVTSGAVEPDAPRGLQLAFTFDSLDGRWPYLVTRDLLVRPDARLADVLESRHPGIEAAKLDPMLRSEDLKSLVLLAINALLYATSPGVNPVRMPPAGRSESAGKAKKRGPDEPADRTSADEVFYLPGTIDISRLRQLQQVERSDGGRELMHRFMVRGHWRRAAAGWKDGRPRWIKPYWKGPDLAAVVERAYRLIP